MNISSAKYVAIDGENVSVTIMVDDERISVPINASGNRHWEAILEWAKEDGNTIEEAD